MADPAVGLGAPAHPELDDPAAGPRLHGDNPHGCLGMGRLLDTLDAWADRAGVDAGPPERFAPTTVPAPVLTMPLTGVGAVVWATGFRPELSFLSDTGVLDRQGRVVHNGGVTAAPGLYVMGLPFLRRRRSTLIDGAAADARELADHLVGHLSDAALRAS